MAHVVSIETFGGPEVLQYRPSEVGEPAPDELRVRHTAIGLNFIDVYERTGLYDTPLPAILGREAAGVVEAVGSSVKGFKPGDRIAYASQTSGAYATSRLLPARLAVRLPDDIADDQAAAAMLKGLTAQFLLRRTYRVKKGDPVLIHAAAGGVGLLLVQWAKHLGARVIAVVSTVAKASLVSQHGADHVVMTDENLVARVRQLTSNQGVAVVYDSVGKDTFIPSLDCLRPRGMMVSFGNASGPVPPIAPLELVKRGSLFLTRPSLFHYIATQRELTDASKELFSLMRRSSLKILVGQKYLLSNVVQAHRDLEARRTTGSTILQP